MIMKSEDKNESRDNVRELQGDINKIIENKQKALTESEKKVRFWRVFTIAWLLILLIILLYSCSVKAPKPVVEPPEIETAELVDHEVEREKIETPHIDIPVIQSFTVSKSQPYIDLYNPETNADKYYLQYTFTLVDEEEPFYQSKLVEGGYKFSVDIGNLLDVGEYRAYIATSTYEYNTYEPKSGDVHEISITITE